MKAITLSGGEITLVDDEDFEYLNQWQWCASHTAHGVYVSRTIKHPVTLNIETFLMHRVIMNTPKGLTVDHKNHNGLDNRRHNLRNCTMGQNLSNRRKQRNNTSGYKGVTHRKGRIIAQIGYQGKVRQLGTFQTLEGAAKAYDAKAKELFGEFAFLNFPD